MKKKYLVLQIKYEKATINVMSTYGRWNRKN